MMVLAFHANAESATTPRQSYEVLHRLGLLQRATPSDVPVHTQAAASLQSERIGTTARHASTATHPGGPSLALVKPAPVSEAASAAEPPPSALARAYNLLRLKGLLPGVPGAAQAAHLPAGRHGHGAERVVVDKSERRLFLLRGGKAYREYAISLGGDPKGPKQRAGDEKTPEGTYTLDWRNPRSRFYKSIHISYPNADDRIRAERLGVDPGGDIMLHGEHYNPALQRTLRRARQRKDWTEGCIALNNEHIDEIWREVSDGTPIEIRP
jgi:lipoprotein-anchoring transpeptidase ErfK/SrfK